MALIKCPHCGKMISDKAPVCPKCGYQPWLNDEHRPAQIHQADAPTEITRQENIIPTTSTTFPTIEEEKATGKAGNKGKNILIGVLIGLLAIGGVGGYALCSKKQSELQEQLASEHLKNLIQDGKEAFDAEDYDKAFKIFTEAAEQDAPEAEFHLGLLYLNGWGCQKDEVAGFKWALKAAEGGFTKAKSLAGYCLIEGIGVKKNEAEGVKWYQKAIDDDDALAAFRLSECYLLGSHGIEKNYKKGIELLQKASAQDVTDAQFILAGIYYNGDFGVPKNKSEAAGMFKKLAEQGHAQAMFNYGMCLLKGDGVYEDVDEGIKWMEKSAAAGCQEAIDRLNAARLENYECPDTVCAVAEAVEDVPEK